MNELLNYSEDNELNILYGFKFLTMVLVLCGHRFFYLAGSPLVYAITVEDVSCKLFLRK